MIGSGMKWSLLLFLILTSAGWGQETKWRHLRTDYPLRIWVVGEMGPQFVGMTNSELGAEQARQLVEKRERIFLTPEWVEKDGVADAGYRLTTTDFSEHAFSEDGTIWPGKGRFKPAFGLGTGLRLFVIHRWPILLFGIVLLGAIGRKGFVVAKTRNSEKEHAKALQNFINSRDHSDPRLSKRYGSYLLSEPLGQGGMSAVYKAVPASTLDPEEAVAIKILLPHLVTKDDNKERFRREITLLSEMSHPNIIKVREYGEEPELFYAMDLISGKELRDLMPLREPSLEKVVTLLRPVFSALGYAHDNGVIHRDLKPENILLDPKVGAVVMDFGLAKREDLDKITATGSVLGTALYLAPEQINGVVNPRTDQYALGVILYECFTGRGPFEAEDPMQLVMAHLTKPPRPMDGVEPGVETVVMRMLTKDPEERYATMGAALAALEAQLGG